MASKDEKENERNGCTFQWNIENISHCWPLKKGEKIESPSFIADALKGTKWSLWLYPMGEGNENYVGIGLCRERDCTGPSVFEISLQIALLGKDNSVLKPCLKLKCNLRNGIAYGIPEFEVREKVFFSEREKYLPEDTLTIQCTIWIADQELIKSDDLFATTVIELIRLPFIWKINEASAYISDDENKSGDPFAGIDTNIKEKFKTLELAGHSTDDLIYFRCKISVIGSKGERGESAYFNLLNQDSITEETDSFSHMKEKAKENKSRYFPNDVLSLEYLFTLVYVEHRKNLAEGDNEPNTGKEETKNTEALIDDLKALYKDGLSSDTELRTSTRTFPAHIAILSARSPVFRSLFSSDMREKISGHVDIDDFENDTIHRMLLYMYTDSLEDLQFESTFELYKISDKYQILSLRSRCASFLKDCLCPSNSRELLILADLHSDDDLKGVVQDYILRQNKQFFLSRKWKNFMTNQVKLASDVIYQKMCQV